MSRKITFKRFFSLLIIFILGCSTPQFSWATDLLESAPLDAVAQGCDIDIDFCDNPFVEQTINDTHWYIERNCNKESLVGLLVDAGVVGLLKQNFFLKSNNVTSRSLLDYPEYLPFRHDADKNGLSINLFLNQTSRGFYTRNSTNICSYLAITQPDFLAALDTVFNQLALLGKLPFDKGLLFDLIDLFSPFTLQERRMGFMVVGKHKFGYWHASIQVPWYYLERNHFVDLPLQEEIDDTISEITGVPSSEVNQADQERFKEAHFIADKFGLGDTRIMIDYAVFKRAFWTIRVGGLITIPTAFSMNSGLLGSNFCRFSQPPLLDLCAVVNTSLPSNDSMAANNGIAQATSYFLNALDNLSAMLLETPLGNGGHCEVGLYMKNKFPVSMYIAQSWSRRLVWRSFTAIQYTFPAWDTRSFILPVNPVDFAEQSFVFPAGQDTQNAVLADQAYNFIVTQLTERLFPIALHVKVHPKWIFRMTSQLGYEAPKGGFAIGTDTWIRSAEGFSNIQGPPAILNRIDVCDAKASFAYQAKVFGSAYFKKIKPGQVWAVGGGGDYTYWSKGIGADFTLYLFTDITF